MAIERNVLIKNGIIVGSVFLVGVMFVLFVVRPAVMGYAVYSQAQDLNYSLDDFKVEVDELQEEMKGVRDGLSECYKANEKALGELNDVRGEKIECEEKLDFERQECSAEWFALNFSFAEFKEDCSEDIDSLREDLNEKVSDFEELERDYEKIVESSARSICCKKKVDDASINSFEVVGGKIVCLSGGENRLKC